MITDEDIRKAIDRIGSTEDGALLYLYCQQRLLGVLPSSAPIGALHDDNGERRFARQLMNLLSKGIADSDRDLGSGRPIVVAFGDPQPVASGRRSLRRGGSADDSGDAKPAGPVTT